MKAVLKDATAGDSISGIKWTRKTLRAISVELTEAGFKVGHVTVRRLLIDEGYQLRTNRKRLTKSSNPDGDEQMRYIAQSPDPAHASAGKKACDQRRH